MISFRFVGGKMKIDFMGMLEFEIDWKAVAFLSMIPIVEMIINKL